MPFFKQPEVTAPRSAEAVSQTNEGEAERSEVETASRYYLDQAVQ